MAVLGVDESMSEAQLMCPFLSKMTHCILLTRDTLASKLLCKTKSFLAHNIIIIISLKQFPVSPS